MSRFLWFRDVVVVFRFDLCIYLCDYVTLLLMVLVFVLLYSGLLWGM